MAIVETSWKRLLSPDSEIPPDIFFLVKREEGGNYSGKPIGAHKIFLAGVSTVFMRMFFGPLKETREVIEVRGTTSEAFTTMIDNSVIRTATVAKEYMMIFEYASTKLLVTCLKFFLKRTRGPYWINMDLWTRFWALINNPEVPSLKERLAGTPFVNLTICHDTIKTSLDEVKYNSYEKCLFLACSGVHVR